MKRQPPERIAEECEKVTDRRDPPVPVWVWLTLDGREWAGELLGWADNPNGADDGLRGLVLAPREYAAGFWAEYLGWVRAEHIRRRER
jgi:hypothetical protein